MGTRYFAVLSDILGGTAPEPVQFASDGPLLSETPTPLLELGSGRIFSLLMLVGLVVTSFLIIVLRSSGGG